ncbi:MAG TPA: amidohydrolase family protein, partial [Xanthomonadales bacterium]|nr:amidohydrolase family protein [Xanthomonadales bacterium]
VASGKVVSPALIVVAGGRITDVNPASPPADAELIELPELTVLPGMIDVHTHLAYEIVPGWETESMRWTTGEFALRSARNARLTLLAGFTTVREVGAAPGFVDVATMKAIERGDIIGPHVIPSGHAISTTGGHCDVTGFAPGVAERDYRSGLADGVDEVIKAIRYQVKHGAKSIKICATAGVLSFEGPVGAQQYSFEELKAAADETHRHGLKIAAHAHGTEGIIAASEAGIDFIEHDTMMTEEAARIIKKNGTWVTPTIYLTNSIELDLLPAPIRAKAEYVIPLAHEGFRRAVDMQLKIAFGTDAGVYPHGENARELESRVALGMSPLEAVRSATLYSAEALGTGDRGQVKAGLMADLIAVQGNPLEDVNVLQDVRFVMKGGVVYKQPE